MKSVIVLPTYNERNNVSDTVRRIFASAPSGASVLIVDDDSPDGTGEIADSLAAQLSPRVEVLHRYGRRGLGGAYMEGFRLALDAGAEAVFEMDADGSHDPVELPKLLAAVAAGNGVAVGSRRVVGGRIVGWAMHRHLMSSGAMGLARFILGLRTKDVTSGYRAYSRAAIEDLLASGIKSGGYAFQEETLFQAERSGYSVVEIPITFSDRKSGRSKLSWKEIPAFFKTIFRLRLNYGRLKKKD